MEGIDYGTLFGVEIQGEKAQEAAEPAETAETPVSGEGAEAGGNGQEVAEPAEDPAEGRPAREGPDLETDGTNQKEAGGEAAGGKPEQTPEERAAHAAARRRAEREAAVEAAVQAERERQKEELETFFRTANLRNTMTGEPIRSMEEFRAWKQAYDTEKLQKDLKAGRLTEESLTQAILNNPVIRQAQTLLQEQEAKKQQAERDAAQARVELELKEIQKLDPSIREIRDLLDMPRGKEFYALVKKGNSFLDAFKLANYDVLTSRAAAASRQAALNSAQGKQHLSSTAQRGAGAVSVPPAVKAEYLAFNPGATDAEIQQHYNRYLKNHKK